jgi:hypothetical protein
MELAERRIVARIVRFGLIALAIMLVAGWFLNRVRPDHPVRFEAEVSSMPALGAGDMQLFNEDSTVDLILAGDRITAGLAPRMVTQIREEMARVGERESTGLGGSIARIVTEQVADKIGTRVVYSIRDIEDIRYDDGRLVVDWRSGRDAQPLLGNVKVDGDRDSNRFSRDEALRFIEAVRARKAALR